LIGQLKYPEAARALEAAWATDGNARATVVRILELQGVIAATTGQDAKAASFFRALASLDPSYRLGREYGPRVTTPFYEAKGWMSERQPLSFAAASPEIRDGRLESLKAGALSDPASLGRKVRFHLHSASGDWAVQEVTLIKGEAQLKPDPGLVGWWAELLGEHRALLAVVGGEDKPLMPNGDAPRAEVTPPPPPTPDAVKPPPPPAVIAAEPQPQLRPLAYGLAAGAAAAGVVGVLFGQRSASEKNQIVQATTDANGVINGITQKQAAALQQSYQSDATVANVLFGVTGALAVGGAGVWMLGNSMAVIPTAGGVAMRGAF
jgi:hypothetical protein